MTTDINDKEPRIRLVVYKEHTLGCIQPGSRHIHVFRGSILRGAPDPWEPVFFFDEADVRLASKKDFDDYRVVFSKYYTEDEYEFQQS